MLHIKLNELLVLALTTVLHLSLHCAAVLLWNSVQAHYSNWRHRQSPAATGPDVKGF